MSATWKSVVWAGFKDAFMRGSDKGSGPLTRFFKHLGGTEVLTSRCQWVSAVGKGSEPHLFSFEPVAALLGEVIVIVLK
jgi:hypothetical protein